MTIPKEVIEAWIETHDCHLSSEDGCPCGEWREQLHKLQKQEEQTNKAIESAFEMHGKMMRSLHETMRKNRQKG